MLRLLGVVLLILAVAGAVVFRFGWRRRHPGEAWPPGAVVSFASVLLVAVGLLTGRTWLVLLGAIGWLAARLLFVRPT